MGSEHDHVHDTWLQNIILPPKAMKILTCLDSLAEGNYLHTPFGMQSLILDFVYAHRAG